MSPRALLGVVLALACAIAGAQAQDYPTKPVRLIVAYPAGGPVDITARALAPKLTDSLHQPVVVDNRGGAGGTIGINAGAKAAPDGYTLLLVSVGYTLSMALNAMPRESMQWFTPVASLGTGPSVLVVNASLPVNSLQDLIALAKRKPGSLNAASAGAGSFQHLATELFRFQTGIDIVIIQYKGGGPALNDTIAGQVQMNVGSVIQNLPHVRSGKLRALGIGGHKRISVLPDVPTFAEQGLQGAEATNWWGLVAPAGTPAAALERLEKEMNVILESPETQKRFQLEGSEVLRMTPEAFGQHVAAETDKWTRVVKQAGIKAE